MAGSETTGQALGAAVWELGRNPEIQKRLREEVQSYSNEPTVDDLTSRMPYLDAVCREGYVCPLLTFFFLKLTLLAHKGFACTRPHLTWYVFTTTDISDRVAHSVPLQERDCKKDDVVPLRHPITDKDGKVHTHIFIKAGQVCVSHRAVAGIPAHFGI